MKLFKQLIYWTLLFALIRGIISLRLGVASALNDATPIVVIAIFLTILYWIAKAFSNLLNHSSEKNNVKSNKEWEIVKKYVPEVNITLTKITNQLDKETWPIAEAKLQELFFVLGKEGLTDNTIEIIVSDLKTNSSSQVRQNNDSTSTAVFENVHLVEKLKGKSKYDFSSSFEICEVCQKSKTGQILDGHYICGNCKQKYL